MTKRLFSLLLLLMIGSAAAQDEPPVSTNLTLSLEAILALKEKPDDRSRMIPEIKAMVANAKKYSGRVVILTAEGQSIYPKGFTATEKWVDGKWVVTCSDVPDFPGEDKESVYAMTYDAKSKTFLRFNKHPSLDGKPVPVTRQHGKQVGDTRTIVWKVIDGADGAPSADTTETFTDTSVNWKQVINEDGKYKMTLTGSAKKVR